MVGSMVAAGVLRSSLVVKLCLLGVRSPEGVRAVAVAVAVVTGGDLAGPSGSRSPN